MKTALTRLVVIETTAWSVFVIESATRSIVITETALTRLVIIKTTTWSVIVVKSATWTFVVVETALTRFVVIETTARTLIIVETAAGTVIATAITAFFVIETATGTVTELTFTKPTVATFVIKSAFTSRLLAKSSLFASFLVTVTVIEFEGPPLLEHFGFVNRLSGARTLTRSFVFSHL